MILSAYRRLLVRFIHTRHSQLLHLWLRPAFVDRYEETEATKKLEEWLVHSSLFAISILIFGGLLFFFTKNLDWFTFALFVCVGMLLLRVRSMKQQASQVRQRILYELPDWVNALLIRFACGDSIHQAFVQSIRGLEEQADHPLYQKLFKLLPQLQNHVPLQLILDQLNRSCRMLEVSQLTSTLLMYQQRGGLQLVDALKGQADRLWQTRKQLARKKGEEASIKLIFPLMLIFAVMLAIVGAPALMMNGT